MIELRKIRHIVVIARLGGFAKAAGALHITQSALTKSVQSVEDHLGLLLLERGPRGVRPTPEGERFIERGSRLLADAAELEIDARAVRDLEAGRVRIGAAPAGLDVLLLDVLPRFAHAHPGVSIETEADDVERIRRLLLEGELDLAIGAFGGMRDTRDLQVEPLHAWPLQPFVRRGHPLDQDTCPSREALLAYPWVGQAVPEPHASILRSLSVAAASRYDQPHIVVRSFEAQMRVVEQTETVSTVFARHAGHPSFESRFKSWPDSDILPPLEIDLVTRANWQPTHAAQGFLALLKAAA